MAGFGSGGSMRRGDRDRLLFVAAAFMAFSLLVIMLVVLNYQSDASAGNKAVAPVANAIPNLGTVKVLVPEKPIKAGQKLSEATYREMFWPRNNIPEGAIMDKSEVKDMYAKVDFPAGQPITRTNFTNQINQMTLPVTQGNRAVTIDVDATSGIEGFAQPGTRVDVVLTYTDGGQLTSEVIVQNARVLSAGGETKTGSDRPGWDSAARSVRTITLDVAPQDALKITTSRQLGRLNLMMRSEDDNNATTDISYGQKQLGNTSKNTTKTTRCSKGHVKVNGEEWSVGCDGTLSSLQGKE
jgi:pilus assembly protein CpaB